MAKVAKPKNKDVSVRSRAARRAASPSIDVDKSILNAERPREDASGGYTYSGSYGGVEKKKKQKKLSRQQRLRLEKGMEKAEQNSDKLSKKVADSRSREKKVKTRNAPWEELNEKASTSKISNGTSGQRTATSEDSSDEEIADGTKTSATQPVMLKDSSLIVPDLATANEEDDEIL
ncbi:hypothetical protein K461DRAFT_272704, partial [Myriangium duriaei CBS 260.36]